MKKVPNLHWRSVLIAGEAVALGRWEIGPALRRAGFKGVDLWADGPAFSLAECRAIGFDGLLPLHHKGRAPMALGPAAQMARRLTALARATKRDRAPAGAPSEAREQRRRSSRKIITTDQLIDDYLAALAAEVEAGGIAAKTAATYRTYAKALREPFGQEPPAALTKEIAGDWLRGLRAARGAHVALKSGAMLTRIFNWAEGRDKWAALLPDARTYKELRLARPAAKLRVGLPEEMEALLAAFDHPAALYAEFETPLGDRVLTPAPSMGDALIALLWSAARVNDALSFSRSNLHDGRLVYRQQKTGRVVDLPLLGAFAARLPAMLSRSAGVRASDNVAELIVNEEDGYPYWRERPKSRVRDHRPFNERWPAYRALAALKAPSLAGEGLNRLGETWTAFNAQDCRDTAATRLGLAGCSLLQIAAWHGSSPEEVAKLAKHYIEIGGAHADSGGEKLVRMCADMGIAV